MQLDSQIGSATMHISSRNTQESLPVVQSESLAKIADSLNQIMTKLAILTDQQMVKTQSVNVYNNLHHPNKPDALNKGTQTIIELTRPSNKPEEALPSNSGRTTIEESVENVEIVLQCTLCGKTLQSNAHLENHIESVHAAGPSHQLVVTTCNFCDVTLSSTEKLHEHISQNHPTGYLQCPGCMLRFQDSDQLSNHVSTCHTQQMPGNSTWTRTQTIARQSSTASLSTPGVSATASRAPTSSSQRTSPTSQNL